LGWQLQDDAEDRPVPTYVCRRNAPLAIEDTDASTPMRSLWPPVDPEIDWCAEGAMVHDEVDFEHLKSQMRSAS
jgi:hypothetical protein